LHSSLDAHSLGPMVCGVPPHFGEVLVRAMILEHHNSCEILKVYRDSFCDPIWSTDGSCLHGRESWHTSLV